ncbi:MAG: HesA/MoeB/ThiF family protein [Chitinophagales bacterium]
MHSKHSAHEKRYLKQTILKQVGIEGQQKLIEAKILVVGAGALASPVLQYLTAAGIGTIGIIDDDIVSESNLHRQVLFTTNDIGFAKVQIVKDRLNAQNPLVNIETYKERLSIKNAIDIINKYDIIVDCTDNFPTRYLVNDACIKCNKPFVYGAIEAFFGQVAVFNYQQSASYRCLFPEIPKANKLNCNELGVIGILPNIIGSLQANEVIKMILGIGNILSNKLLTYNALTNESKQFNIKRNDTIIDIIKQYPLQEEVIENCEVQNSIKNISSDEFKSLQHNNDYTILDVRQIGEHPILQQDNVLNISLALLPFKLQDLDKQQHYIVVCQSGARSKQAAQLLADNNLNTSTT